MVQSLGFLGVRTAAFDETVALYRDILGLTPILVEPDAVWFRAADGAQIHVYGPTNDDHDFFDAGPVVGLVVDDFDATRAGDGRRRDRVHRRAAADAGVGVWNHYRGPDGNVYEIMGRDRRPDD